VYSQVKPLGLNAAWLVKTSKLFGAEDELTDWQNIIHYGGTERDNVSWVKRDQLDVTCFIISLLSAQHVSDVNTSILRSLRLMCWVISWIALIWFDVCWCYVVVWLGWCGIGVQAEALVPQPAYIEHTSNQINATHEITQHISRKLLRMDVLTSETCWALSKEIIKQVTSSWSLFIQLSRWCTVQ